MVEELVMHATSLRSGRNSTNIQ
jgi:hypothetical protein